MLGNVHHLAWVVDQERAVPLGGATPFNAFFDSCAISLGSWSFNWMGWQCCGRSICACGVGPSESCWTHTFELQVTLPRARQ